MKIQEKQIDLTLLRAELGMIGTPYHHTSPSANAVATFTVPAPGAGKALQLYSLTFSYSAAPVGGLITVVSNGVTLFEQAIVTGGPGPGIPGFRVPTNQNLVVTLSAGGTGVVGRVSASVGTV